MMSIGSSSMSLSDNKSLSQHERLLREASLIKMATATFPGCSKSSAEALQLLGAQKESKQFFLILLKCPGKKDV